ncbi:MAG: protein-L-isoaspartate(D-aspartate) O-methyltransferase [Planctomycetota bacterium]|nr:MAG: protein-L-isoaspartate(D-aspartate) O-methyltransferase [Planctomycetota bacterium]
MNNRCKRNRTAWRAVWVAGLVFTAARVAVAQVGLPFPNYEQIREQLIREVLIPGGVTDPRVLEAIRRTPRHEFVPPQFRAQAYYDRALPIGESQTISSPYIVAIMTQELDTKPEHKVLEIGTGSGYQAAVLSPLVKEVYTIEIVPELGERAARTLRRLGYTNVYTKIGDGYLGWPEHAPFDRIIVTCSPEDVPQPLVDQLAEGGLMIIPVGERYQQMLYLMRKTNGKLEREALRPTLFVPMTGEAEERRRVQADPAHPALHNGDFEEPPDEQGYMPGWYYQRGLTWESQDSPSGQHHVRFTNDVAGRPSNLSQGLALDGRIVKRIRLAGMIRLEDVRPGLARDELPGITIRYFDEDRDLVGTHIIGGFRGNRQWREESRVFRVPTASREAIVSIGLFGATGVAEFDRISLEAVYP